MLLLIAAGVVMAILRLLYDLLLPKVWLRHAFYQIKRCKDSAFFNRLLLSVKGIGKFRARHYD